MTDTLLQAVLPHLEMIRCSADAAQWPPARPGRHRSSHCTGTDTQAGSTSGEGCTTITHTFALPVFFQSEVCLVYHTSWHMYMAAVHVKLGIKTCTAFLQRCPAVHRLHRWLTMPSCHKMAVLALRRCAGERHDCDRFSYFLFMAGTGQPDRCPVELVPLCCWPGSEF